MLLLDGESVIHPGHGKVHRDLEGLVLIRHLTHLPHREGEVQVHVGRLVVREQEGRLLLVIVAGYAPGELLGGISQTS